MKTVLAILIGILQFGFASLNNLQAQSKAPVRVYLEHFRSPEERSISVRVLAKLEKRYLPAAGVEVFLYISAISETNMLGTIMTSDDGMGTYTLNQKQYELAEGKKITQYFAVVNESEILRRKEAEITIKDVNIEVRYFGDTIWRKQIYVHVFETDTAGNNIPQEDIEIKFLVERPLSPLPVKDVFNPSDDEGRTFTDSSGEISMTFPNDLPGDADGNLQILIRIVEHDDYGTVEVADVKAWGVPTIINDLTLKRSLWASSANAPISVLIFINSLILAVWGTIFYIVFKVFQIRKIGKG
jgi:hypothetical protein